MCGVEPNIISSCAEFSFWNCYVSPHYSTDFKSLQGWITATLHLVWDLHAINFFSVSYSPTVQVLCAWIIEGDSLYSSPAIDCYCQYWVWGSSWSRWSSQVPDLAFVLGRLYVFGFHYSCLSHLWKPNPACIVGPLEQGRASCLTPHPKPSDGRPLFCVNASSQNWVVCCHSPAVDREQKGLQHQMGLCLLSFRGNEFLPRYLVSFPSSGLRLFPCKRVLVRNGALCPSSKAADYLGFMLIPTHIRFLPSPNLSESSQWSIMGKSIWVLQDLAIETIQN